MKGIILTNFGGPAKDADIEAFLESIFAKYLPVFLKPFAKRFAKRRLGKARAMYKTIGGFSPVVAGATYLANEMQKKLDGYFVAAGMEHGEPSIAEAIELAKKAGCEKIATLPLYPLDDDDFCFDPDFVKIMRGLVRDAVAKTNAKITDVHLVFSAHSLPLFCDYKRTQLYRRRVELLAEKISAAFAGAECHVAYQSQMRRFLWLGPSTSDVLKNIARNDKRNSSCVVVIPLGFICENLETLFEVDQVYVPLADRLFNGRVARCTLPDSSPELVDLLVKLARNRF